MVIIEIFVIEFGTCEFGRWRWGGHPAFHRLCPKTKILGPILTYKYAPLGEHFIGMVAPVYDQVKSISQKT